MGLARHLPNALTLCNLACGCLGIIHLFQPEGLAVYWFVWVAMVFDFLDGLVARALRVSSPIGKELDSLADVVSFGVLPALFMFQLITDVGGGNFAYFAILIAMMSALRLAKFNLDERQATVFYGLPTPANALMLTALPFYVAHPAFSTYTQNVYLLVGLAIASSFLLVADIRLISLKFHGLKWNGNQMRFVFLLSSLILIIWYRELAILIVILWYVIFSLIASFFESNKAA